MSGRPIARYACDCAACAARAQDEWDRFVDGHEEVANHLRDVFLNPDGVKPVERIREYLAHTRETGAVVFDDGA